MKLKSTISVGFSPIFGKFASNHDTMNLFEVLRHPWPWYVSGPLIGLMVPLLLIAGNKSFGISSSLRHICAAVVPGQTPFFQYDWKKESWNLVFATGVLLGGLVAAKWLMDGQAVIIAPALAREMAGYGIAPDAAHTVPFPLFSWGSLLTVRGFLLMVVGGFLVGFGTRYAGGCTSGHSIMGLSTLQWPSLVATCCFMAGGFIMANLILPFILQL
jgi:uncharacterized membrane protein YedE/YeeE